MVRLVEELYLSSMFLAPCENSALPFPTSHQELDFFGVQPFRLLAVSNTNRVLEVYTMLVEQVQALLFVI